jgi:hypothetical protein
VKPLVEKVNVAVFDANLRAEIKKYELTDDGSKIRILKGGKKHFYPEFNESSYLDIKRSRLLGGGYKRLYVVRRNASKCIDFKTEIVSGVDPKQIIEATESELIKNFGKEEKGVPWYIWMLFVIVLGIALKVFGMI